MRRGTLRHRCSWRRLAVELAPYSHRRTSPRLSTLIMAAGGAAPGRSALERGLRRVARGLTGLGSGRRYVDPDAEGAEPLDTL
jgi:hypothetical protein